MAVIEARNDNFDELIKEGYTVVDFYGDHCSVCVLTAPIYREVSEEMARIRFLKLNTSTYPKLAKRFEIKGLPTFCFFYNGELIRKKEGGVDRESLQKNIAEVLYRD